MHIIIYLALCALVGLIGKNRKFGFWGYFFASIIFTPIGGLLLIVPSEKHPS